MQTHYILVYCDKFLCPNLLLQSNRVTCRVRYLKFLIVVFVFLHVDQFFNVAIEMKRFARLARHHVSYHEQDPFLDNENQEKQKQLQLHRGRLEETCQTNKVVVFQHEDKTAQEGDVIESLEEGDV